MLSTESAPVSRPLERAPRCAWSRTPTRVDAQSSALRPAQLTLTRDGAGAVALVTLSRVHDPRAPRDGATFPEARLVFLGDESSPRVVRVGGVEPDAEIARGSDGRLFVIGPGRLDPRGGPDTAFPALRTVLLERDGRAVVAPTVLDGTRGWRIASRPVAFDGGYAVIAGPIERASDSLPRTLRASLLRLDAMGSRFGETPVIADAIDAEGLGRHSAALATGVARGTLIAAWTSDRADDVGLWTRAFNGRFFDEAVRVDSRPTWGPEILGDGALWFHSGGERGETPRVWRHEDGASEPQRMFDAWDSAIAATPNDILIGGERVGETAAFSAQRGADVLPLAGPDRNDAARWLDVDAVSVRDGAWFAWIAAEPDGTESPPPALWIARARCVPSSAAPSQ